MSILFPSAQATEPFAREPAKAQGIAVAILAAGAVAMTIWAGHGAAASAPEPVCAAGARVSPDQLETVRLRIRYADAAVTSAAYGGSAYAAAKTGRSDPVALGAAEQALSAAWRDFARLCITT